MVERSDDDAGPRAALADTITASELGDAAVAITAKAVPSIGHDATHDSDALDGDLPALPRTIGRYRVLRRLGAGGMGVVYAAHDPELDRTVAIKLVRERAGDDLGLQHRLRREAQALARLSHANVVSSFDVGVDRGRIYIVMQYVDGACLDDWLASKKPPSAEVIALFCRPGY